MPLREPLTYNQYEDMKLPEKQSSVEEGILTAKHAGAKGNSLQTKKRPAGAVTGVAAGSVIGVAAKKLKTLSSGWKVAEVPKKPSGTFKAWYSADGVRHGGQKLCCKQTKQITRSKLYIDDQCSICQRSFEETR